MIPKRINYVWLGGQPLPDQIKKNILTWQEKNPEYEIIEFNEKNYDINRYQFAADAYKSKKWAFASDVVRLDVLYQYGGFYFDTDVKLIKSLDPLLTNKAVWAMENSGDINSGLGVGVEPHDENVKKLLEIYKTLQYTDDQRQWYDLITTNIISDYFKQHGLKERNRLQTLADGTTIFPSEYFAPYHWWGGGKITPKTIAVQQYGNSWGSDNGAISKYRIFKHNLQLHWPSLFFTVVHLHKKLKGTE